MNGVMSKRGNDMWRQALTCGCLALAMAVAWAADKVSVEVSKSVTLATGSKGFAKIESSVGTATSEPNPTVAGTFSLVYKAPEKPASATVSFENDGKAESVNVEITPPKASTPPPGPKLPPVTADPNPYAPAAKILFAVFALAVVLESGLATIFNWRVFLRFFDAKGVKTLVAFAVAWIMVGTFDLDISTQLVQVFFPEKPSLGPLGGVLSALVLAGGSSGVNNLMQALHLRSERTVDSVMPKPPPTKTWVAVRLIRNRAVGPVYVLSSVNGATAPDVIGTISGNSHTHGLAGLFLRDPGRFPGSGGFAVKPGDTRTLMLSGVDSEGANINSAIWGPYAMGAGAIVDVDLAL